MIRRVENLRHEILFQDEALGRTYGRMVGGLAWPHGILPGHMVILGENYLQDWTLAAARPIYLVYEAKARSVAKMHSMALELRQTHACDLWLCDRSNEINMRTFRAAAFPVDRPLNVNQAPYQDGRLSQVVELVYELSEPGRRILTLGSDSAAASAHRTAKVEDLNKPLNQFPELAALGYALGWLVLHKKQTFTDKPTVKTDVPLFQQQRFLARGAR